MKKNNMLIVWRPTDNISEKMYVEALHDDYEGFRILLKGNSPDSATLRISFEDAICYRNTNESYLLKIWHKSNKSLLGKTFYKIEDSSYLEYFHEMTQRIYMEWKIEHYSIYTDSDCIDILSIQPPKVEWLN